MNSADYWFARSLQREAEAHDGTADTLQRLSLMYSEADKELVRMIDRIFRSFRKYAAVDDQKARELLSTQETSELLADLRKQFEETGDAEALAKLSAPAYGYRISRLQAARRAINAELDRLSQQESNIGVKQLRKTYEDSYYKTMYDTRPQPSVMLPESVIDQAVTTVWKGKNYSARVWDNRTVLAKESERILSGGIAAGKSIAQMTAELSDLMNVGTYAAARLIRTEANRMHNDATIQSYKAMGITEYIYLATLDAKTCAVCGALDLQVFKLADARTGVNLPPIHPNDRCTIAPKIPGVEPDGNRTARNPETNRNYKVPADMSYEEWRKDIDEKLSAGRNEYEQIKESPIRRVPDIDTFQKQRYNNSPEYQKLMQRLANIQGKGNWKAVEFNPQTSDSHFEKHGSDIGAKNAAAYKASALKFVNEATDKEMVIDSDGVRRFYSPATNEFASVYPDGTVSTYYKPRQGAKYWERQVEKYGSKEK